jgi:hypothetical protein
MTEELATKLIEDLLAAQQALAGDLRAFSLQLEMAESISLIPAEANQ